MLVWNQAIHKEQYAKDTERVTKLVETLGK